MDATGTGNQFTAEEIEEGKSAAVLAYIPFLCLVPLLNWQHNRFALAHAKQGLALFVIELVVAVLLVPGVSELLLKGCLTLSLVLAVIGIVRVLQDKSWKLPLIGDWIEKYKL